MKKATVLILALLSILSISSFAGSQGGSLGVVPQTTRIITVDAVKDDIYDQGLFVPLTRPESEGQNDYGTSGAAYCLFNDGVLYIYVQVIDNEIVEPTSDIQTTLPWETDSVEIFIAPNNTDEVTEVLQYRIDVTNWPSFYTQTGITDYGPEAVGNRFKYASKRTSDGYALEFAIPVEGSKKEGFIFGFHFQINDIRKNDTAIRMFAPSLAGSGSWTSELYEYSTVGAMIIDIIEEEIEEVAAEPSAPTTKPATAAQTSDIEYAMFAVLALISIVGAVLIVKKTKK